MKLHTISLLVAASILMGCTEDPMDAGREHNDTKYEAICMNITSLEQFDAMTSEIQSPLYKLSNEAFVDFRDGVVALCLPKATTLRSNLWKDIIAQVVGLVQPLRITPVRATVDIHL